MPAWIWRWKVGILLIIMEAIPLCILLRKPCLHSLKQHMLICGNKMPTRCNRGFYCRSYCLSTCFGHHYAHHQELKSIIQWLLPVVFRAVVFQVAGLVWSWGLCVRFAGTHNPQLHTRLATWKTTARNTTGSNHCIILLSSWWWA